MRSRSLPILGILVALLACASIARAATITATLIPTPPPFEQPLNVRLADSRGSHCWPPATSITQSGSVITVALNFSDSCNPANILAYRDYLLGSFHAGDYVFVYKSCSDSPPPLPSTCNTVLQLPFSVAAPPPVPMPALSWWAIALLAVGIIIISARAWRSRQARIDRPGRH